MANRWWDGHLGLPGVAPEQPSGSSGPKVESLALVVKDPETSPTSGGGEHADENKEAVGGGEPRDLGAVVPAPNRRPRAGRRGPRTSRSRPSS
uniref:Uncharacterized protein n=1 Tax=Aegilops tauschii TaxID=37682 RepID=N1QWB5_AEGTA